LCGAEVWLSPGTGGALRFAMQRCARRGVSRVCIDAAILCNKGVRDSARGVVGRRRVLSVQRSAISARNQAERDWISATFAEGWRWLCA